MLLSAYSLPVSLGTPTSSLYVSVYVCSDEQVVCVSVLQRGQNGEECPTICGDCEKFFTHRR